MATLSDLCFTFADDTFRGSSEPDYASGSRDDVAQTAAISRDGILFVCP